MKRKSVNFWKKQVENGTLIAAIRAYPAEARNFFGSLPAMREDLEELTFIAALTISAKKLLSTDDRTLKRQMFQFVIEHWNKNVGHAPSDVRKKVAKIVNNASDEARRISTRIVQRLEKNKSATKAKS